MTTFSERTLPHNAQAEQNILGAILLHPEVLHDVVDVVTHEHFYRDANRRIFKQMLALYHRREPIDLTTLREQLTTRGELDEVGGAAYITALVDGVPRGQHVTRYAEIVREKARLRQIIATANTMLCEAYDADEDASTVIDRAEQALYALQSDKPATGFVRIGDLMTGVMEQFHVWHEAKHGISGVPSGFAALDTETRGFQPGNLVIIGARPSLGKSTLALNAAQYVALTLQKPAAFFSLEMSKEELAIRAVTAEARVDGYRLQRGWIRSSDEWRRLAEAVAVLGDVPLYIDDSPFVSALDIRSRARRLKGLALLVVDYTQLMVGHERRDNRTLELASVTRALKALAKELAIPVLALSQLNRSVEDRDNKRPRLADLRESGALEQDSDVVLFIHRDDKMVEENTAEIIIAKHRNGPVGSVRIAWRGEEARFANLEERQPEPEDRRLPMGDR